MSRTDAVDRCGVAVLEAGGASVRLKPARRQRNVLRNGPPNMSTSPFAGQKTSPARCHEDRTARSGTANVIGCAAKVVRIVAGGIEDHPRSKDGGAAHSCSVNEFTCHDRSRFMDSRFRGNDGCCLNHGHVNGIIPACAGIDGCCLNSGVVDGIVPAPRSPLPAFARTGFRGNAPKRFPRKRESIGFRRLRMSEHHTHPSPPYLPSFPRKRESTGFRRTAHVRASHASIATVLAVIPAQAGIHRLSPPAHVRASHASIATVLAVIPAQAGIQTT